MRVCEARCDRHETPPTVPPAVALAEAKAVAMRPMPLGVRDIQQFFLYFMRYRAMLQHGAGAFERWERRPHRELDAAC